MSESKLAPEVAEAEFVRLCELRRLDIDESAMSPKELESFTKVRARVLRELASGALLVDEKGIATYTPPVDDAKPISFRMPKGSTYMAMDDGKAKGEQHQMVAMISDMTGWTKGDISKLAAPDYQFCGTLVGLFLG